MSASYETELYRRIHGHLESIKMIDSHEHLQRESELPLKEEVSIGRLFVPYVINDLVSAGMPMEDVPKFLDSGNGLSPKERWKLIKSWYEKSWNTVYCEAMRIFIRDLYGVEDLSDQTVDRLTETMRKEIKPGFTRKVFDRAGIDFALNNPFGPDLVFNPDYEYDCFMVDMIDCFNTFIVTPKLEVVDGLSPFSFGQLSRQSNIEITCLDDYLRVIDFFFERDAKVASGFKIGSAYHRTLCWEDVPRNAVEGTFNRLLAFNDRPDRRAIEALENYFLHYLCRKCSEYRLSMKFHTGMLGGNGNIVTNSRAALMTNLFLKYPKTHFEMYHISYPYQDELVGIAKNFPNVTINFCWTHLLCPSVSRRTLADMLDTVPANKIHGFGGDYIFVEGAYAHAVIARREIARVLCEKVEEGRFTEEYAARVGTMLLRDNPIENFNLESRRAAFKPRAGEKPREGLTRVGVHHLLAHETA